MNKKQVQAKVKKLKKEKGLTLQDIADRLPKCDGKKYSVSSVERACQNWYKGDSSRVYWAFSKVFK
jgi:transcriptional regulator with XRE-family HTH domain